MFSLQSEQSLLYVVPIKYRSEARDQRRPVVCGGSNHVSERYLNRESRDLVGIAGYQIPLHLFSRSCCCSCKNLILFQYCETVIGNEAKSLLRFSRFSE